MKLDSQFLPPPTQINQHDMVGGKPTDMSGSKSPNEKGCATTVKSVSHTKSPVSSDMVDTPLSVTNDQSNDSPKSHSMKGCSTTFESGPSKSAISGDIVYTQVSVPNHKSNELLGEVKQPVTKVNEGNDFLHELSITGSQEMIETSELVIGPSPVGAKSDDEGSEVNTQADMFPDNNDDHSTHPATEIAKSNGSGEPINIDSNSEVRSNDNQTDNGDFQCSRCFRNFFDYIKYNNHIHECQGSTHRYRCIHPGCPKEYSQRSVMLEHHKSVHQATPYLCTEENCQHKYSSQKALKAHIKEHHKSVFKYRCQVCNQRFFNRTQYSIHLTRHTNIKPFGCMNCKKASYSTAAQLSQHVSICLFGSVFRCDTCGKNFASQTTLKQHISNVHQFQGEFKCDLCPKVYRQYASLFKHKNTKHGQLNNAI